MDFVQERENLKQLIADVEGKLADYWNTISETDNEARYHHGKIFIVVASSLVPVAGWVSKSTKVKKILQAMRNFTKGQWDKFFEQANVRLGRNLANAGNVFKVDNSLKLADEAVGILVNGKYLKNPTAKNVTELIKNQSGTMKLNQNSNSILNGQYMYVIDESDNIIIGTRAKGFNFSIPDGKAPHPTLIGGADPTIKTAGIIEFRGGKIYKVDNVSGHFKPSAQSLQNSESIFNQYFSSNNFATDFQGYIPFTN